MRAERGRTSAVLLAFALGLAHALSLSIAGLWWLQLMSVGLLALLLAVDVLTLALSERQVVCYACGAVYSRLRIARYLRRWDRSVAERVAREPVDLPAVLQLSDPAARTPTPSPLVTPSPVRTPVP